jgi:hypothetical protein
MSFDQTSCYLLILTNKSVYNYYIFKHIFTVKKYKGKIKKLFDLYVGIFINIYFIFILLNLFIIY